MNSSYQRAIAAAELALVAPAALFMTALFVRNIQPQQYEPAHTAQGIVMLYASSAHVGLWLLLIAFPLLVLVTGCVALWNAWLRDAVLRRDAAIAIGAIRPHVATLLVALATLASGAILAVVALHVAVG